MEFDGCCWFERNFIHEILKDEVNEQYQFIIFQCYFIEKCKFAQTNYIFFYSLFLLVYSLIFFHKLL
jgi:hypothetical protein